MSLLGWAKFLYDVNRDKENEQILRQQNNLALAPYRAQEALEDIRGADPNRMITMGPSAGMSQQEAWRQNLPRSLPTAAGRGMAKAGLREMDARRGAEDLFPEVVGMSPKSAATLPGMTMDKYQALEPFLGKPAEPPTLERVETPGGYSYMPKALPLDYQGSVPVVAVDGIESPKSLEIQKQQIKEARELRNRQFDDSNTLRDEYIKQSGDFVKVRDAYSRVKASTDTPSAAGDLALIFNYMKMLDPGSVVRESEFANAAATGAFGERIQAAANRIISGERLSDEMRRDFVERSGKLYKKTLSNHDQLKKEYRRLAKQNDLDPTNVIVEFGGEEVEQEQPITEAPQAAIDFLLKNPTKEMKQAFQEKYKYLPEGV